SSSSGHNHHHPHPQASPPVEGLPNDSYDIDYYSGLDSSDSDSDDEEFGSNEDDEILGPASRSRELSVDSLGRTSAMEDLPVTGFAVASSRRNAEFHELFPGIPEGDYLIEAFVIPNAIQITTRRAKYTFASFLARDTTFDVIWNIWRVSGGAASGSAEGAGAGVGASASGSVGGVVEGDMEVPGEVRKVVAA
ncbi:hypothetical protein MPER_08361, partial [Moniliophthora perniciosa FA553]